MTSSAPGTGPAVDPAAVRALVDRARHEDVRLVRFLYVDPSGVTRGKAVHVAQLASRLRGGVGLTRAQNAINVFDDLVPIDGLEPIGEIRLLPDLSTWTRLPWLPATASLLCDQLAHDGTDWGCCPRLFLARAIDRLAAAGITAKASFENEFYLAEVVDGLPVPFGNGPVYSSIGMDRVAAVMDDVVDALDEQGLQVEQAINEYGPGQQEISIRYADAMRASDNQVKFKDTVRGVVEVGHGLLASFAPKPFPDGIGSGAHLHFSLWDHGGRTNLLGEPGGSSHTLSALGRHFVAGVLEHLPGLVALTCPSVQSYDRLKPSAWASAFTSWGYDNREAAVRVASPFWGEQKTSLNLELKPVDGSANPYLALGGLLVAGLDGVQRELEPPPPAERDPAHMHAAERDRHGVVALPSDLLTANDLLEKDSVLTGALGPLLTSSLLALRRAEHATASERGDDAVRAALFSVF